MNEGQAKNTPLGTKLQILEHIPDNLVDAYATFLTELINQVPRGEINMNDMVREPEDVKRDEERIYSLGGKIFYGLTIEKTGELSGVSYLIHVPQTPTVVYQGLTGVRKQYRGRGLGKWLKAALLLHIKEVLPNISYISTGNATTNEPMLHINEKLGFQRYKTRYIGQLTIQELENYFAEP